MFRDDHPSLVPVRRGLDRTELHEPRGIRRRRLGPRGDVGGFGVSGTQPKGWHGDTDHGVRAGGGVAGRTPGPEEWQKKEGGVQEGGIGRVGA